MTNQKGWQPIPSSLKILSIIFVVWVIGSFLVIPVRYLAGLPFFGIFVYGTFAAVAVFILDVLAPSIFLFALWNRKSWGPKFALFYIAIFILNNVVTMCVLSKELGIMTIFIPLITNIIFLAVIYGEREYFK